MNSYFRHHHRQGGMDPMATANLPLSSPPSSSSSSSCDRRLSRAARELMVEQWGPILSRHRQSPLSSVDGRRPAVAGKSSKEHQHQQHSTLLTELEHLLEEFFILSSNSKSNNSNHTRRRSCPWLQRDVYWHDEMNSKSVLPSKIWDSSRPFPRKVSVVQWGIPRYLAWMEHLTNHHIPKQQQPQQGSSSSSSSHWFQCGDCGKVFSSRYYLDQHLTRHHSITTNSTICPAVDWCQSLIMGGVAACAQRALHNEPYYDRGSGGLIQADRTLVYHQLRLQTHAMTTSWCSTMNHSSHASGSSSNSRSDTVTLRQREQYHQACLNVMEQCFESQVAQTLQKEICQHLFSCPRRHHHQHPSLLPEHWNDEWHYYSNQAYSHPLAWLALVLILGAVAVWSRYWAGHRGGGTGVVVNARKRTPGTRLLQPLAHRQHRWWWWPSSSSSSWLKSNSKQLQQSSWTARKSKLQ